MKPIEEILKQYPFIVEDIQREQSNVNKYIQLQQEARDPLRGQVLTGMPHEYGISDQTYQAVVKIIDEYQAEINRHVKNINELLESKRKMDKAYTEMTDDERRLLYLHYEEKMSYRQIGRQCKCGRYMAQKMLEEIKIKISQMTA